MKEKVYGWTGKILRVNLTTGKIKTEPTMKYAKKFLGGKGINSWILHNETRQGTDPLSPENRLIFGTGPLEGTLVPSACRLTITAVNMLTRGHGDSNSGGHFSPELKFAGYDHIVFEGRAEKPVYLWIDDERVELRDASDLWGMTTHVTDDMIKEEIGDCDLQTACIGPAGERLVRLASVHVTHATRACGRTGMGAVMGSKNLKAVAVRGSGSVEVAEPEKLIEIVDKIYEAIKTDEYMKLWGEKGVPWKIKPVNDHGGIPINNFQSIYFDGMDKIDFDDFSRYYKRHAACFACPVHCDKYLKIGAGEPYAGTWDYDMQITPASNFAKFRIGDVNTCIRGHWLANDYGIDIQGALIAIGWAVECYERGILTKHDTDGLVLKWEDPLLVLELLRRIVYREGKLGDLLAEGVAIAAGKIGRNSKKYAMHIKGMELDDEVRTAIGWGFGVITAIRGAAHLQGATPFLPEGIDMHAYEGKPKSCFDMEHLRVISDCLEICAFASPWYGPTLKYGLDEYSKLITAAMGWKLTKEDLLRIGERILNVMKATNARAGITRKDDYPPERMFEPIPSGPWKGTCLNREKFEKMLDEYYELHGWDIKTGIPTRKTLESLGLKEVADELENLRILA